ncbi:tyrosine-type recombinase/integrase [Aliarcobacter lanthieri]|uniref:tyrosine-type recombinase/integrase n=1 Tax=Aliarcobacter lanthieri TaxID=1355374 RepID=UPI003AA7DF3A
MSRQEFIKRIPSHLQDEIGLKRFKISLNKCLNQKQVKLAKLVLEMESEKIFKNNELQTKDKAKNYLKDTLNLFILEESGINLNNINKELEEKLNVITIQDILNNAIKDQEREFANKMSLLATQGVDTKIKKNNTKNVYKAILKDLTQYFGDNYDIKNLTFEKVKTYASKFKNDTYIKYLKSIFKKANNENPKIINLFEKLETSTFQRFSNINKEIKIFYYNEIENILLNSNEEEQYFFKTLLYSGMRCDEISSLKKSSIKSNCFYFKDSKNHFNKIVPIHKDLIEYINKTITKLEVDDYIFFSTRNKRTRVSNVRDIFNFKKEFREINKTLHKTRATFITYLNFFKENFSDNDIKSLTHKIRSEDQESYNKTNNVERLREIINSIDLSKLITIEEQVNNFK